MICPAYQSAFIYDKDELRKKFSYFLGDSTPKVYAASKNKYLVAEPVSYRTKIRSMQTVAMKAVNVVVPDSLTGEREDSVSMADFDRAARSIRDSIVIVDVPKDTVQAEALDSIYVITKDKELRLLKYNAPDSIEFDSVAQKYVTQKPSYYIAEVRYQMEQDNYMWYLRDAIVLPDVRLAKLNQSAGGKAAEKKEKQGLKGFFKNLFKKKPKEAIDSASQQAPPKEEFDYVDEADSTLQAEIPQPGQEEEKPKKKVRKKKEKPVKASRKKDNKPDAAAPEPAEKKEEDEDDGF